MNYLLLLQDARVAPYSLLALLHTRAAPLAIALLALPMLLHSRSSCCYNCAIIYPIALLHTHVAPRSRCNRVAHIAALA